jgi:hypothetical protein
MKKSMVFLFFVLVLATSAGGVTRNRSKLPVPWNYLPQEELEAMIDFFTMAEIETIFYENRELLETIKNELFASGFVPHSGVDEMSDRYNAELERSIRLEFDYSTHELFAENDPCGEKLQAIQNVHEYAIVWFMNMREDFEPVIFFRETSEMGTIVQFNFRYNPVWIGAGIMYKPGWEESLWVVEHLDDDWYMYWLVSVSGWADGRVPLIQIKGAGEGVWW